MERVNPFAIDLAQLHEEWRRQPQLSREAGHREAEARRTLDHAKTTLKVVEAQLLLKVRLDPAKHGLDPKKLNKELLEAVVLVQPEYLRAANDVTAAQFALGVAEADRVAVCHDRRKALENEVELLCLNYFSEAEPKPVTEGGARTLEHRRRVAARRDPD